MDQPTAAYWLDCKSSVSFYLCIFFDLLDIACVNCFLVYNMKHPKQLTLPNYKIVLAKNFIRWQQSCQRTVLLSRPSKRKSSSVAGNDHGDHLPEFQTRRKRCALLFIVSLAYDIPLCLVKDRNPLQSIIYE